MRTLMHTVAAAALAATALTCLVPPALAQEERLSAEAKETEKSARLQMADEGLRKLYQLQPGAKAAVEKSVGYAVFSVDSIYAVMFVGQRGKGVLIDNGTKKQTFMLSSRAGTGPGVGKQKVYQVFVFKAKSAMDQFLVGGKTGGDLGASVSTGKDGLVRSFNPSIDIYQVPESGIAVQASWGGTLYSLDSALQ